MLIKEVSLILTLLITFLFAGCGSVFAKPSNGANILQLGAGIGGSVGFSAAEGGTAWSGQSLKSSVYGFYSGSNCSGTRDIAPGSLGAGFSPANGSSYGFDGDRLYTLINDITGSAENIESFSFFFSNALSSSDGTTGPDNSSTCACFNVTCSDATNQCIGNTSAQNIAFSTTHCTLP